VHVYNKVCSMQSAGQPPQSLVTFDEIGCSGHPNHIATFRGVCVALPQLIQIAPALTAFKLNSTNIVRKYSGVFDIMVSCLLAPDDYMDISLNVSQVYNAMTLHKTQFVWYRRIFVLISRFSYVNTYTELPRYVSPAIDDSLRPVSLQL